MQCARLLTGTIELPLLLAADDKWRDGADGSAFQAPWFLAVLVAVYKARVLRRRKAKARIGDVSITLGELAHTEMEVRLAAELAHGWNSPHHLGQHSRQRQFANVPACCFVPMPGCVSSAGQCQLAAALS